ncbi:MAG: hypothetical protein K2Q09_05185, partial [Phycisphaerales bacterium]|nr:hypothetical protein [Phycisphaerales bacterium]
MSTQPHIRLFALAAGAIAAAAASAGATTITSFTTGATFNGVHITPLQNGTLSYTVTLDAGAYFTLGGNNYAITDVIGVYLLAYNYDDNSQAALGAVADFSDDSDNRGAGSIYGWRSNPNAGITAGGSQTFV